MPGFAKLGKVALVTLGYLVAFDLIGVLASFFFDVAPVRGVTGALFYAIWFVLGVFAGLLSYNLGGKIVSGAGEGDWSSRASAPKCGLAAISMVGAVLVLLFLGLKLLVWKSGSAADSFVPDSEPLTITYFGAALVAAIVGQKAFLSVP